MARKKTHKEFVDQLREVQPNLTVIGEYAKDSKKLLVKDHLGIRYSTSPSNLLQGNKPSAVLAVDKDNWFRVRSKQIHGESYDHSRSKYLGDSVKVEIICLRHGSFWQTPASHLKGRGCMECGHVATAKSKRKTTDEFILEAENIHQGVYDYSKSQYINSKTKINIICPSHGVFTQVPNDHLNGHGCTSCAYASNSKTTEQFIYKANKIHKGTYSYYDTVYTSSASEVVITCKIHGAFKQKPKVHLEGHGCKKCASYNHPGSYASVCKYTPDHLVPLYIIKCSYKDEVFYKIGLSIDCRTRFYGIPYEIELLKIIEGPIGRTYPLEQSLKKKYAIYKYIPQKYFGGYTECFSVNPLKYFKELK